jgi:hypothetical protein
MSVINYLVSRTSQVRMPFCPVGVDSLGIKWIGEVVSGKLSVPEAIAKERPPRVVPERPSKCVITTPFLIHDARKRLRRRLPA